jgi:hypothetical protein
VARNQNPFPTKKEENPMKNMLMVFASVGVFAACLPASGQASDSTTQGLASHPHTAIVPIAPMAVPGTSASNPFSSFDITYFDPRLQLVTVSSRSSKAIAIFNGRTDQPVGETPAVFAGVGIDDAHSGPNGNLVAGTQLWAGDYPSIVRVFDLKASLTNPPQIASIDTGGTLRADEMDYDPAHGIVAIANTDVEDNSGPPFVSLISTTTFEIKHKVVFDGTNGTPDASVGGLGAVLYDSMINKFLITVVQVGTQTTNGAVAVLDPISGAVTKVFEGINNCEPAGMAQGPGENVLIGCDPGFPAPAGFTAHTYIINGRTGKILKDITAVGGEDESWYNPGDGRYYTGSRDYFTDPSAAAASPVLGVIDARTNQWIENIPTGPNSHSVAANPLNNHIFVPMKNPNTLCNGLAGCVEVYGYQPSRPWKPFP